jgi:hypothetical protein
MRPFGTLAQIRRFGSAHEDALKRRLAFGGGTHLTLWRNIDRRFISWGAAGWHICFDVLDRLLSGTSIGRLAVATRCSWQRLNAEYAKQFGMKNQ